MPNRILRDYTDSELVDKLSAPAEVLFIRLFMKADDYGLFHANPKLVKSACFPLREVKESDIVKWLSECNEINLIDIYEVEGKKYLKINNFNQRLRVMTSKYPSFDSKLRSDVSILLRETKRKEVETKPKQEVEIPSLDIFLEFIKTKTGNEFESIKKAASLKYAAWFENGWKDGYNVKISNWKSKAINAIQYFQKDLSIKSDQPLTDKNWNK